MKKDFSRLGFAIVFLQVVSLFFLLRPNESRADCTNRISNRPVVRDVLSLRQTASYSNPNYKGVNRQAVLTRMRREVSCPHAQSPAHIKCFSDIRLVGRASEGDTLRIPQGALINISRINNSVEEVVLYPRKVDGLIRTRSGTFRFICLRYILTSLPNRAPRESGHKRFTCFNEDIDLLFENISLQSCSDTTSNGGTGAAGPAPFSIPTEVEIESSTVE
jgi:hypothetical protein